MIFRRLIAALGLVAILGAGCSSASEDPLLVDQQLGTAESGSQWINYDTFQGFQTRVDAEKVPDGANVNGQNTTANRGDRISIRDKGYEIFPSTATQSATTTPVGSIHTFHLRDGSNILLRAVSTTLEWYEPGASQWETLKSGYTSSDFGFADNNINTDQVSYTYFGNGNEPFSRWSGGHSSLSVALAGGEAVITVPSTDGFTSTGSLTYCGFTSTYTSKTATEFTLSGVASACALNRGVAQSVEEFSASNYPRGNIYLFADNRLFVSGVASSTQVVYFSEYGDVTDFGTLTSLVTDSTDASPGLFNLAEGGGAVVSMILDEGSIYIFKRSIIYKATLSDTIYSIAPLKSFDQKSQTSGAVTKRSTFTSANGTFFITPDNQIMYLSRALSFDYPQITPVSDPIKNTVDALDFSDATGAVFRDKAYFSVKSSSDSRINDTVLVYNIRDNIWDSPIVGWNASDFAIYQEDAEEGLYFGDSGTGNVYSVTDIPLDSIYAVRANWRSKQYTYGAFQALKLMENVYVEGYITPNTNLRISLLLDEDGFTQRYSTTLSGNETQYIYDSSEYNVFGFSPFGTRRFGSNEDLTGKKKFRIYLGKDFRQVPFHSAQIEFASDGENEQWEVTNYAFLVRQAPVPEKRELFKSFK